MDRFWSKVEKSDGCWTWTGGRLPRGYGRFYWNGRTVYAHRVSLELAGVTVPADRLVMHSCDNPSCVNPAHLSVGTQFDNMRDAAHKGRTVRVQDWHGAKNPKAKLTERQTEEVRLSRLPAKALAATYGVTPERVYQIRNALKGNRS